MLCDCSAANRIQGDLQPTLKQEMEDQIWEKSNNKYLRTLFDKTFLNSKNNKTIETCPDIARAPLLPLEFEETNRYLYRETERWHKLHLESTKWKRE